MQGRKKQYPPCRATESRCADSFLPAQRLSILLSNIACQPPLCLSPPRICRIGRLYAFFSPYFPYCCYFIFTVLFCPLDLNTFL